MKQATWFMILFLAATFGGVAAAQADEHYQTQLNTLQEVETILELITDLDKTEHVQNVHLSEEKQMLKNIAIAKLKSI